jgi:hypothetical protein
VDSTLECSICKLHDFCYTFVFTKFVKAPITAKFETLSFLVHYAALIDDVKVATDFCISC